MTKAVRIHSHGGPEVMRFEDVPTPEPGPGEARVRHEAIGVNFIDVYFRTGLYKIPSLPAVLGQEGAGVVTAIGPGVTEVAVGDRVAYAAGPIGAYATERVIAANRLVKLPDAIDFKTAAAMMLKGMTAQYLLRRTYRVKPGDTILVYAAAGGVGLIMCQWAKHLGAHVIGVVSTEEKAQLARAHGAEHVVVGYKNLVEEVKRITNGAMVPVVYDSVGKDTFYTSL
ncbi:MAG: quinone oxidoreductase, partial [Acetobacteraceae bacterium]|nr:quinone oxidoreductase [Acetobacteraceae bacterium]